MTAVVQMASSQANAPESPSAVRPVPGDVVCGRILRTSPGGHTILQIGPHRVVSDRPISGRPGDILQFEVLPPLSKGGDGPKSSAPLLLRLLENAQAVAHVRGRATAGQAPRLHLPSTGRHVAVASSVSLPVENQGIAHGPAFLVASTLQLVETLRVLGRKWIQRTRQRLGPAARHVAPTRMGLRTRTDPHGAVNDRPAPGVEKNTQQTSDLCWDYAAGFKLMADRDDGGQALIHLQPPKTGQQSAGTLTAWLVLDLEKIGTIEIDVQISAHFIRVQFRVDNEEIEGAIRSKIGCVRSALKNLTPEVYCGVQINKQPNGSGGVSTPMTASASTGIDCTI
jgi:hypothetical protein